MVLDKVALNNRITALKVDFIKARAQIIQNLIKKIAHFKEKSKEDDTKYGKKVETLGEEIKILKKFKFRDVIKSALLLEKSPQVILTSGTSTPTDRCIARICEHKKLSQKLKDLQEAFQLNEEENKKGLRAMGERKLMQKKKLEEKKGKPEKSKKPAKPKKANSTTDDWTEEPIDGEGSTENEEEDAPHTEEKEETQSNEEKPPKPEKVKKPKKEKKIVFKKKIEPVVFSSEDEEPEEEEEQTHSNVDSFFITNYGSNYVSTAPLKDNQPEQEERPFEKPPTWQNFRKNQDFQPRRSNFHQKDENDLHPSWAAKKKFKEIQPFNGKKTKFNDGNSNESDLHPSWAAKQKLKEIKPFQGKKVKFDDEGESKPQPSWSQSKAKIEESSDLHPSWAAKKLQQKSIAAFSGSKIKFDD